MNSVLSFFHFNILKCVFHNIFVVKYIKSKLTAKLFLLKNDM